MAEQVQGDAGASVERNGIACSVCGPANRAVVGFEYIHTMRYVPQVRHTRAGSDEITLDVHGYGRVPNKDDAAGVAGDNVTRPG